MLGDDECKEVEVVEIVGDRSDDAPTSQLSELQTQTKRERLRAIFLATARQKVNVAPLQEEACPILSELSPGQLHRRRREGRCASRCRRLGIVNVHVRWSGAVLSER